MRNILKFVDSSWKCDQMSKATATLDELIKELPRMAKRLSFHDKCAAYYALERGFPQSLIAKALGVSSGAMSALANCRNEKGGGRYQDVRNEYDRLGHDAFGDHYFTDDFATKLQRFRMGVETDADRARMHGPDTRGGKWGNKIFTVEGYGGRIVQCIVEFRSTGQDIDTRTDETLRAGWAWRELIEREVTEQRLTERPHNCPPWSNQRWPTAARAVDGCYESHGVDSQRLHPDWPNIP
jgi:hypothetical protein